MRRIGVTGHVNARDDVATWVAEALRARLRQESAQPVRGVTCLARGPDQLSARAILAVNGTYEVTLPACDYSRRMDAGDRPGFEELLDGVSTVETMPLEESHERALPVEVLWPAGTRDRLVP